MFDGGNSIKLFSESTASEVEAGETNEKILGNPSSGQHATSTAGEELNMNEDSQQSTVTVQSGTGTSATRKLRRVVLDDDDDDDEEEEDPNGEDGSDADDEYADGEDGYDDDEAL